MLRHDAVEFHGSWISPSAVIEYVRKKGWENLGGPNGTYVRLRPPIESDGLRSVLLPLDPSRADFLTLLDDALAAIADYGSVADERLLLDLNVGVGDKISFRKDVPTPYGSIPWLEGERLVTSSTKILIASAKAERQAQSYFGNKHRTHAKAYLEAVRMGQTELGSYVITAFSPTEQISLRDVLLPTMTEPSTGRAVTETLVKALAATRESIDFYNARSSLRLFEEAIEAGASYELSRSLIGLIDGTNGADVKVQWESAGSVSVPDAEVAFRPDDIVALERASIRFAQTAPPERVTVLGTVTLLERARPRSPGVFRLDVLEGSQAKKIRVRLRQDAYELAIQAFSEGRGVLMSGRQEKEGHLWWLYDPSDISIVDLPQMSLFEEFLRFEDVGAVETDE
jgi:hypothetical protein